MPNDFDKYEAYADDFLIGYELALQQKESKFKPYVKFAKAVKGRGAQVVDHVLPFEANTRSGGDVADTNLENSDFLPRWAYTVVIDKALAITNTDRLSMLADPSNELVMSMMAAFMRALDGKIIVPAFFRDVEAGADKDVTRALPASQMIAKDVGGTASGLNRDMMDAAYELFETNEVDMDEEQPVMGITPRQHRLLRNLAEVRNRDFDKLGGVMKDGKVTQYLGFRVFVSNRLNTFNDGTHDVVEMPVWVPSGLCVQPWLEPKVRINERPDKQYITQLYCEARWGAIRTEEGRVIKVTAREDVLPS